MPTAPATRQGEVAALVFPRGSVGEEADFPPDLPTLDSLSSANSYCEVNVKRSG